MRRALALCAIAVVACSKADQKADTTPPAAATPTPAPAAAPAIALADVAGTWEGQVMPVGKDTVVATATLTNTATMDGWKMKLSNGANPAVKVESVAGDSIIATAGPFASAVRKGQQVTTHSIIRLQDGKLVMTTHAKYANGDTGTYRIVATKKP
jgi:glucose/arabinose dehydrogenase